MITRKRLLDLDYVDGFWLVDTDWSVESSSSSVKTGSATRAYYEHSRSSSLSRNSHFIYISKRTLCKEFQFVNWLIMRNAPVFYANLRPLWRSKRECHELVEYRCKLIYG
ncbi:hypothetical protein CRM22_002210 [Opisthorchis felineus]|uniref:Uncharacterized protein n=1 Tax=Opisthorchis felineus TaxID=147828 RepID=A0A4S2M777_OPIFE|nr:hypothetical protein CRM22_002210 [Opisthorchis felineus]